jgi:2-keto-4-pentenoate hydratase/2-oxohepta-3-ene-1,7-dioic acid hydratase in catechol pathway
MKIICIGRNYADHAAELGHERPAEPLFFMKPDSALLQNEHPFVIPEWTQNCQYEVELIVRIERIARWVAPEFAHRCYREVGVGIDFTARDVQGQLKAAGHPWEKAKAFDGSAVRPLAWTSIEDLGGDVQNLNFQLELNGKTVQSGNTRDMLFTVDQIIAHLSKFCTLKTGDLIYTGTPAGVGPVAPGDQLTGRLCGRHQFTVNVM